MIPEPAPRRAAALIAGSAVTACAVVAIVLELAGTRSELRVLHDRPIAVELVGNHTFPTFVIRAAIESWETPLVDQAGELDNDAVSREVLLISAFYWDHGHVNVKVGKPRHEPWRQAIAIDIDEGPVFTLDTVHVTGELIGDERAHLAMLGLHPGETFARTRIADARTALSTFYEDRSYAFVDVDLTPGIDVARRTVAIGFKIVRGEPASFERVDIVGATKTGEAAIRRVVTVAAGQPFNLTRLEASRRQVAQRVTKYSDIAVSFKRGSAPDLVIATFEISEP